MKTILVWTNGYMSVFYDEEKARKFCKDNDGCLEVFGPNKSDDGKLICINGTDGFNHKEQKWRTS